MGLALDLEDCHPSVLLYCWLGHLTCKIVSEVTYNVSSWTLNPTIPYHTPICPQIWWTLVQERLRTVGKFLLTPWIFSLEDIASLTAWTLYNRQPTNFGTCYVVARAYSLDNNRMSFAIHLVVVNTSRLKWLKNACIVYYSTLLLLHSQTFAIYELCFLY